MKYTNKTEYGLVCMIYMARSPKARVSIKELTHSERYPVAYLEKVLQALRRAGLVSASPGKKGGYSLVKRPSEISLKDVICAIEGKTFETFCGPGLREAIVCNHACLCGVKPVWRKTKDLLDNFFGSITLEMLMKDAGGVLRDLTSRAYKAGSARG